jgi:hypothetical protein
MVVIPTPVNVDDTTTLEAAQQGEVDGAKVER